MSGYILKESGGFKKDFRKLPPEIQRYFNKQFKALKADPFSRGKMLGNKWFRELKIKKFRIYYIISDKSPTILLVDVSTKKTQQDKIERIRDTHRFLARERAESDIRTSEQVRIMDKEMQRLIKERDRLRLQLIKELHWLEIENTKNARN